MKYLLFLMVLWGNVCDGQVITTVGGNGISGYYGDGGSATNAKLKYPGSVILDSIGNFYFVERLNHIIRKISNSGIISTIAGNGNPGFLDNVIATNAQLDNPIAIAIDKSGKLIIADEGNNRIRCLNFENGLITTIAGNGILGFGGDGGAATDALLNYPTGVACDDVGNFYISDHLNFRIRKVDQLGVISTYVGDGISGYAGDNGPSTTANIKGSNGLACDNIGNLFFADGSNTIRKVDKRTKIVTTIAGNGMQGFSGDGGLAINAKFFLPVALVISKQGFVYVCDADNNRIREISPDGIINTIVGNGVGGFMGDNGLPNMAELYSPEGVCLDSCNNIYIADEGNNRIRKVTYPKCHYLSVDETQPNNPITIHPNPATSTLQIDYLKTTTQYHLYNMLGITIMQGTLKSGNTTLPLDALQPGIYMLALKDENGEKTVHKVVKE